MDPLLAKLEIFCTGERWEYLRPFQRTPSDYDRWITSLDDTKQPSSDVFTKSIEIRLCFGLIADICQICNVHFNASDFLADSRENGKMIISFRHIEKYTFFLIAAGSEPDRTIEMRAAQKTAYRPTLLQAAEFVNRRHLNLPRKITCMSSTQRAEATVLVAVMALVKHLDNNAHQIFRQGSMGLSFDWVRSPILDDLLLGAAWCLGELGRLNRFSPVMRLYLSTVDRSRPDKNHSACTPQECVVNQIDTATYETAHVSGCAQKACRIVESPVEEICDILGDTAGAIPLVRRTVGPLGPKIETTSFHPRNRRRKYTAISHVWSDGTGNPRANGLYDCQLRKIQGQVDALDPDPNNDGETYFWMDTLCVPLVPRVRAKAIVLMTKTYLHADKVLVLDRWLETFEYQGGDPKQLLTRIGLCDWSTRMWTFNEGMLARECRFQLSSGSVTIDEFLDESIYKNIGDISKSLYELPPEYFANHRYALLLLKAVCLSPESSEITSVPQHSLSGEVRSHSGRDQHTQPERHVMKRLRHLADSISGPNTFGLEHDVFYDIEMARIDTVLGAAFGLTRDIRGVLYTDSIDRSLDLDGTSRQIRGFDSPSYMSFLEVISGFSGRTTSRIEDETICIGGLIGLDISSIFNVRVDNERRHEQQTTLGDERMKAFLLLLSKIRPSILLGHFPRLQSPGFRWAPRSFLGTGAAATASYGVARGLADITANGLIVSVSGVYVSGVVTSDVYIQRHVHVQHPESEGPLKSIYTNVEAPMDDPSSVAAGQERDYVFSVDVHGGMGQLRGFLAVVEGEEDGEELPCRYLMPISWTREESGERLLSLTGQWFWERRLRLT